VVVCEICGKNCGIALTNKHMMHYHNITLEEYTKRYPSAAKSWNDGMKIKEENTDLYNKLFSPERNNKISKANVITWNDSDTREKRIRGIIEDYKETPQFEREERNRNISLGEIKAFQDPIKRENKLKHIYARKGNKEFGKQMSAIIHNAIKNGFRPENNAYTVARFDEELGHIVRSSWEHNVGVILVYLRIRYIYEYKCFDLNDCFFTPDFYFPDLDFYLEVAGVLGERKQYKLERMSALYPNVMLKVLAANKYDKFISKFGPGNGGDAHEAERFLTGCS